MYGNINIYNADHFIYIRYNVYIYKDIYVYVLWQIIYIHTKHNVCASRSAVTGHSRNSHGDLNVKDTQSFPGEWFPGLVCTNQILIVITYFR